MGLFKPAWMSKNKDKAFRAIGKVKDQAKLGRIAKTCAGYIRGSYPPKIDVGGAAVEQLSDQSVIADVAKNGR